METRVRRDGEIIEDTESTLKSEKRAPGLGGRRIDLGFWRPVRPAVPCFLYKSDALAAAGHSALRTVTAITGRNWTVHARTAKYRRGRTDLRGVSGGCPPALGRPLAADRPKEERKSGRESRALERRQPEITYNLRVLPTKVLNWRGGDCAQGAKPQVKPPSTRRLTPVMYLASSEARKSAA